MTIKSTEYVSCGPICCGNSYPANIIICIPSTFVLANPGPISYIRGTLGCSSTSNSVCGQKYYRYIVSYDDAQLIPDAVIMGSDITGIICDNCIIQYIDDSIANWGVSQADGLFGVGITQATGLVMAAVINRVGATSGVNDAVVLPDVTTWPYDKVVIQAVGGTLQVFPSSGQFINALAVDIAIAITDGNSKIFYKNTAVTNKWQTVG